MLAKPVSYLKLTPSVEENAIAIAADWATQTQQTHAARQPSS